MKKKKIIKKLIITFVVVIGIFGVMLLSMYLKMNGEIKSLKYYPTDMNKVEDGVYQGKAETTFVKVEVEVEVKDHKIVSIDILKHDNGFGKKAERITEDMINKNTYDVDAVSGATSSSQVIKSAVSAALASGDK